MQQRIFDVTCPDCRIDFSVEEDAPYVRSGLSPVGNILMYRINSEMIKEYLIQKVKRYNDRTKLDLVVKFCEKKCKDCGNQRGYASLRIGFSDDIVDRKEDSGWFEDIGSTASNPKIVETVFNQFIKKFRYSREYLDDILANNKKLEYVENTFGMTESFLEDIKMYCTPKRIPTTANESWIIFSARAESVINDMLENPNPYGFKNHNEGGKFYPLPEYQTLYEELYVSFKDKNIPTKKLELLYKVYGKVEIHSVYPINKDTVEFIIYVHPENMVGREDPYVRKILTGEKK